MKRKLKTIKQILDENPDAYFDDLGYLHKIGEYTLFPKMFCLLGEEVDTVNDDYSYDESWFEPLPEPKKLFAFEKMKLVDTFSKSKLVTSGEIIFRIDDIADLSNGGYIRRPEYDIEYPMKDE